MIKYVHIDYRSPRNREEKRFFALTNVKRDTADVFVNVRKNRKGEDLADTFFHEMAHVFCAFHGKAKQMSSATEERLARQIGRVCAGILQ
jgi:hypothetical protein